METHSIAFENALILDQFNEKRAKQMYQAATEPKAAQYLRELEPPTEKSEDKPFKSNESNAGVSLSEFLS